MIRPCLSKPPKSALMTRLRADLYLLMIAVIWGLSFVFQKSAMAHLGPLTFIAARSLVAIAALLPLAIAEYRWLQTRPEAGGVKIWPPGLLGAGLKTGCAFMTAAALQQFGLLTATASNGGFLTALYVVLTPPLAWALRGTRPGPVLIPAVLLSAMGTWMLGGGSFAALSTGDWLVAACAIFWALHSILSESAARYDRPVLFSAIQLVTVAGLAAIGATAFETARIGAVLAAWREILFVGLLASALTVTVFTMALKHAPASEAAVIVSTESLFAALAGAMFLGERLTIVAWAGAGLIMAAVVLVQVGPRMRRVEVE